MEASALRRFGASAASQQFCPQTRRRLRGLGPDHVMILTRPGRSPLLVSKVRYYAEAEFQGLFDAL